MGSLRSSSLRLVLLLAAAFWLATAWWARREFLPYDVNNTDIGTYLFQAQTFASGRIWRTTPEPREFFQQWQAIVRERSYAYYPPGHALLLAVPIRFGLDPWLVPWLLSGFSLGLLYVWARQVADATTAAMAMSVMAVSPYFAANAASLLSHSTTLCLTLLFLYAIARWQRKRGAGWAFAGGLVLAAIFATRPVNAAALGLIWIPWMLWRRWSESVTTRGKTGFPSDRGACCDGIAFATGAAMIAIPLLIYYRMLGGFWRLDLFTDYWPHNRFGFGQGFGRGEPGHYFQTCTNHDLGGMLDNWRHVSLLLARWWSGNLWFSLVLLLMALALAGFKLSRLFRRAEPSATSPSALSSLLSSPLIPVVIWAATHVLLYSLYYTPSTAFSGPRYLVEIMPALAILTGWCLMRLQEVHFGKWAAFGLLLVFVFCAGRFSIRFYTDNARGVGARRQVEECVLNGVKPPALVFIRSFWIGHPFPIFLNRPDLSGPILYACDRGADDRQLAAMHPHRNAYILCVTPLKGGAVHSVLVPLREASSKQWLAEPEQVRAPFFVGSKFTPPLELRGETARRLFHPKPGEIEPQ
ncbi:MAG: glycosyltransferase family 39 protein [Verrucomicrobia bacterium]|nr:glycosyltransferase family 39 protein [Verrucomicrobiota bacterium]